MKRNINFIFNYIRKIREFLNEKIYPKIDKISTWMIFSTLFIFIFGNLFSCNLCDDDLTMKRVQRQIPSNLVVSAILMEDIHGFGNESLIVLAADKEGSKVAISY